MRAVSKYENKYMSATGCWISFHKSAIDLRVENANNPNLARCFAWDSLLVQYALRFLGLRTEF